LNVLRYSQGGTGTGRPSWADSIYDASSKNIASLGCAMSCVAMTLTAFGDSVNPGELNAWMKARSPLNGGYDGELVTWDAILYHSNNQIKYSYKKKDPFKTNTKTIDSTTISSPSILDDPLNKCKLVIVQVVNSHTGNQHWVVVTEKDGGEYKIVDPGVRNENVLSAYGAFWGYLIIQKN